MDVSAHDARPSNPGASTGAAGHRAMEVQAGPELALTVDVGVDREGEGEGEGENTERTAVDTASSDDDDMSLADFKRGMVEKRAAGHAACNDVGVSLAVIVGDGDGDGDGESDFDDEFNDDVRFVVCAPCFCVVPGDPRRSHLFQGRFQSRCLARRAPSVPRSSAPF